MDNSKPNGGRISRCDRTIGIPRDYCQNDVVDIQTTDVMLDKLLDGRYRIIQVLSAGGFGETYIAEDTRRIGNPRCVVKHLKPASDDPNYLKIARRLFYSEAETLEKLGDHNQIPRPLAYFEEDEEFYLVQDFIEGRPLSAEMLPGQRWSESQVVEMLQDVLGILDFVHSYGVIHRDIKPDNLIRRVKDDKLVLIDFGAVKQVRSPLATNQSQITATVAIGTPGYMPAEQGQGKPRPNSDIYALGMIGIQALTGCYPTQLQEDPNTGEVLWQNYAQVSDRLAAILNKMVRYDYRKDRYQSVGEVFQDIQLLANPVPPTQPLNLGYIPKQNINNVNTYQSKANTGQLNPTSYKSIKNVAMIGLIPFIAPIIIGLIVILLNLFK
ncbi:protein kinase domain-containing protein [Anabaena sp. CCY 9402-a]|uniref:protein kinase domain-containing protein n=1 Tax=Anabaena sp. CCY 9402-a TaxID=3103867 RepID=UPI0039C5EAE2